VTFAVGAPPRPYRAGDDDFDEAGAWRDSVAAGPVSPSITAPERAAHRLRELVDALPAAQSRAWVLREVQAMEPPAICAALGIAEDELDDLLFAARLALCRGLGPGGRAGPSG
jgi:DNA-directed RNA polymerase specialized sigma24 family protein